MIIRALRCGCTTGFWDGGCCTSLDRLYCRPCCAIRQRVPGPLAGTSIAIASGIGPFLSIPTVYHLPLVVDHVAAWRTTHLSNLTAAFIVRATVTIGRAEASADADPFTDPSS